MEEILNELLDIEMCRDLKTGGVVDEINQLLDIKLWRDSTVQSMLIDFEKNLSRPQGLPGSESLRNVAADYKDRVNVMYEFFRWIPEKPEVLEKFTKNSKVSAELRNKGNEFYGKQNIKKAMELYSAAIRFAEPAGEELGRAFANRSAVLVEQQDPAGALKDIDLAMKHNYPETLIPKLEKRREKCVKMLEEFERSYLTEDIKSDMAIRQNYRDELLKLKNPNPLIPSAESFVEIGHTDEVGRQLVVNKDIPAGTVVIVERPFTSVNEELLKFESNHCDHCYKYVKNGIPCKQCVFVLYCSEECRSNAGCGHHKFECSCLSSLYLGSCDAYSLMALRVVCKVGPEEFYRLFTSKDPNYFDIKKPFGTEQGCKYESDTYLSVHHLVSHSSSLDKSIRYGNGFNAVQLMLVLEAQTYFFGVCPEDKSKEFKNFVAAAVLRLKEILPHNGITRAELKAFQGRTLADVYRLKECTTRELLTASKEDVIDKSSVGIYPVGSLINHSCDANAVRVFDVSHGTMAVVTVKALKEGEPLTANYGTASAESIEERRFLLMQEYHFECHCIACKNNWPTAEILQTRFQIKAHNFTCSACSKKFTEEEKCSKRFRKCFLAGQRPTCGLCAKSYQREKLDEGFRSALKKHSQAWKDMTYNRLVEVVETCKEVSEYFQFNISPPDFVAAENLRLFEHALAFILHCGELRRRNVLIHGGARVRQMVKFQ